MFLADRNIKGECPKCGAKDQYGDNCEVCGAAYEPTELKNPYSALTGATPVMKPSEQYFFKLSDERCVGFLREWLNSPGRLQPEMVNKVSEWLGNDGADLADWDISRDAPYFGIPIPDAPGKYFYVWLDAPVGYLATLKNYCDKQGIDYDALLRDPATEQVHFIGKDIVSFHLLFWPAMLKFSGHPTIDRTRVNVHGHMTVHGEKMSKSRGTGISPLRYLDLKMDPEWMRYYIAVKLNAKVEDIDFNPEDFIARVNCRPDRQVRQHRQPRRRLHQQALQWPAEQPGAGRRQRQPLLGIAEERRGSRHPRSLRGARIRQGDPPHHGAGRRGQPVRRCEKALGTGQGPGQCASPAGCLQRPAAVLPPPVDFPGAGAAGRGEKGGGAVRPGARTELGRSADLAGIDRHLYST